MTHMFTCPACGYDGLLAPPWTEGVASDEICPSCGIHFGYDDACGGDPTARAAAYQAWRRNWIANGMNWFSEGRKQPLGWDAAAQLRRVDAG